MNNLQVKQILNKIYDHSDHEGPIILSALQHDIFEFTPEEDAMLPKLEDENYLRIDPKQNLIRLTAIGINYIHNNKTIVMATAKTKSKKVKKTLVSKSKAKKQQEAKKPEEAKPVKVKKIKPTPEVIQIEHKGQKLNVIQKGTMTDKRNGNVYNRYFIQPGGRLIHQKIN